MTRYWLERAWLGDGDTVSGVLVDVEGGRFTRVEPAVARSPAGCERLAGLTIPGLANCHSHAFHRALRGRTQRGRGTFWTWRDQMYDVAAALDPDSYYELAAATYREMAAAGITSVGEFHYLHHAFGGAPYADPNAMGEALVQAAHAAGLRIALLDTCYLAAGIGRPPEGVQLRFSDGSAVRWRDRVEEFAAGVARAGRSQDTVVGAAIHSVRAVPRSELAPVVDWADRHAAPLHFHLSEQPAENAACLEAYGLTPAALLAEAGALGPRSSAVHATHVTAADVALLGGADATACLCPTTERDLGDGIGPSRALAEAGSPLTLGSDSQAVIDPFEEMRGVESDQRLATSTRGHWSAEELLAAGTAVGHRSLGFPDTGRIQVGARADLVTLDTATVRTAGTGADVHTAVFAATAADVVRVVRDGRLVATAEDRAEAGRELDRVLHRLCQLEARR